jgi:hypothetical protein
LVSSIANNNLGSAYKAAATATAVSAQYGGGRGGGYDGGHGPGHGGNNDNDGNDFGAFGGNRGGPSQSFIDSRQKILIAHGVLAALAFVIFFPIGSILVRLGSFRGVWIVHGILQLFGYIIYVAAFGLGVWMVNDVPINLLNRYHPIIGILVFVFLFFQPIIGFVHHLKFKKHSRRTFWSYGHLWLGRILITLGIINGGLGMLLASDAPGFLALRPTRGQIVAYGVIAGIMWLAWVAAAIFGERRRAKAPAISKEAEDETRPNSGSRLPPSYSERNERFA